MSRSPTAAPPIREEYVPAFNLLCMIGSDIRPGLTRIWQRSLSSTAITRKARVVVMGSGRMGKIRASLLRANPRFEVKGIVDTNYIGAQNLADKYGVRRIV